MTRGTSRLILLAVLAASPVVAQVTDTPQRSREQTPNMPPPHETLPEKVRPGDTDSTGTVRPTTPDPKTTDGVLRPQKG